MRVDFRSKLNFEDVNSEFQRRVTRFPGTGDGEAAAASPPRGPYLSEGQGSVIIQLTLRGESCMKAIFLATTIYLACGGATSGLCAEKAVCIFGRDRMEFPQTFNVSGGKEFSFGWEPWGTNPPPRNGIAEAAKRVSGHQHH